MPQPQGVFTEEARERATPILDVKLRAIRLQATRIVNRPCYSMQGVLKKLIYPGPKAYLKVLLMLPGRYWTLQSCICHGGYRLYLAIHTGSMVSINL